MASNFQAMTRVGSETEAHFTAAERILQYMKVGASLDPLVGVSLDPGGCQPGSWWVQVLVLGDGLGPS